MLDSGTHQCLTSRSSWKTEWRRWQRRRSVKGLLKSTAPWWGEFCLKDKEWMWREILSQLENTVEEKNCELGRLGQRLKMNEEHNARSLSSSEDQLTFIDIFISIIIITNMGININYQVVCNSGQAAHWEQWEAAGKILQLLIIFETFSNIQTWISPADNEVLTSLPITSTLTETSKLYGSRFTWRGECMC